MIIPLAAPDEEKTMLSSIRLTALILAFVGMNPALAAGIDWSKVEAALGRQAAVLPGDVHRFGMPRGDLEVTLGHVTIRPALALGAWAAFHPAGDNDAMVMGDLVVTDAEVAPVMKALREGGVAVTALHNHLVGERPKIMYIHMGGHGDPVAMARTIKTAVELTGTPPPAASVAAEPAELGFDAGAVEAILGRAGSVSGGVLHIGVPRAETLRVDGMTVPPSMGAGTAINFQRCPGTRARAQGGARRDQRGHSGGPGGSGGGGSLSPWRLLLLGAAPVRRAEAPARESRLATAAP
jgi:hypothetical protein